MVWAAYFLVVFDHESTEARKGGLLYLLMSRGGSGMMLVGFLLLASSAGSLEFPALHGVGQNLPPVLGGVAFLLLLLGFGVKAVIIPVQDACSCYSECCRWASRDRSCSSRVISGVCWR